MKAHKCLVQLICPANQIDCSYEGNIVFERDMILFPCVKNIQTKEGLNSAGA